MRSRYLVRQSEVKPYSPANHTGTRNFRLIGPETVGAKGVEVLIGLITKHGILIVEFANQLRARGMQAAEAVTEAATLRLRPILMTTGAMVLGALPLALATGAGSEARQPIGWVIVGGLALGTVFTLFVIPTAYLLLTGGRRAVPATGHAAAAE